MGLLLRRITKHVNDQNWFAVFLDFCIVVIGVFIGIQIGNWNEARLSRSLESQYILRLQADLERSLEAIGYSNQDMVAQTDGAKLVLTALDPCYLEDDLKDHPHYSL